MVVRRRTQSTTALPTRLDLTRSSASPSSTDQSSGSRVLPSSGSKDHGAGRARPLSSATGGSNHWMLGFLRSRVREGTRRLYAWRHARVDVRAARSRLRGSRGRGVRRDAGGEVIQDAGPRTPPGSLAHHARRDRGRAPLRPRRRGGAARAGRARGVRQAAAVAGARGRAAADVRLGAGRQRGGGGDPRGEGARDGAAVVGAGRGRGGAPVRGGRGGAGAALVVRASSSRRRAASSSRRCS